VFVLPSSTQLLNVCASLGKSLEGTKILLKCRQQPVLVSHHLCNSDIQSWLSLNEDPHQYQLQKWRLQFYTQRQGEWWPTITLRVRFYHMSIFGSTIHYKLKMSKNTSHNSVHFRRAGTSAYAQNWQAQRLINW